MFDHRSNQTDTSILIKFGIEIFEHNISRPSSLMVEIVQIVSELAPFEMAIYPKQLNTMKTKHTKQKLVKTSKFL